MRHVLVVDDDTRIRTLLRRYLGEEGMKVSEAGDGAAMRAVLAREMVDLVLLDLTLPGEDGLSLARYLRDKSQIPVIILSGKGDLIDRVVGLESGADDYITKPFELREVLARIRTVMRRADQKGSRPAEERGAATDAGPSDKLAFEGYQLDLARRELQKQDGHVVPLTGGEFELLKVFVEHPNRVLNRDQLLDFVKGQGWAATDRSIDTQVGRLRRKIETDTTNPTLIKTIRGGGYIFSAPVKKG